MDNDSVSGVVIGGLAGLAFAWYWITKPKRKSKYPRMTYSAILNLYDNKMKNGQLHPADFEVIRNMVLARKPQESIHAYASTIIVKLKPQMKILEPWLR